MAVNAGFLIAGELSPAFAYSPVFGRLDVDVVRLQQWFGALGAGTRELDLWIAFGCPTPPRPVRWMTRLNILTVSAYPTKAVIDGLWWSRVVRSSPR